MQKFKIGDKVYSTYTKTEDRVKDIILSECVVGKGLVYLMKSGYEYWIKNNNISFTGRKNQLSLIN